MEIFMKGCKTTMSKVSGNTHTQQQLNNYALNQHNPNNPAYRANNNVTVKCPALHRELIDQ